MNWIINKIRVMFCVHDWELLQETRMWDSVIDKYPYGTKWTYRCKKCGKMNIVKNY